MARQQIAASALPIDQARALLNESLALEDSARLAAGMAKGANKRQLINWARQHGRNAIALADAIHGAPSAEIVAMSADDLLAELLQPIAA